MKRVTPSRQVQQRKKSINSILKRHETRDSVKFRKKSIFAIVK